MLCGCDGHCARDGQQPRPSHKRTGPAARPVDALFSAGGAKRVATASFARPVVESLLGGADVARVAMGEAQNVQYRRAH